MRVLVITGDKNFKLGHPRHDLQAAAVERFAAVYWGRGALWPRLPERPFDVVSAQDPFLRGLFGWIAARRFGSKFNVQIHTDLPAQSLFQRLIARFVLRRADSIRAVSKRAKEQALRMGAHVPITVLPVFVDIEEFRKISRQPHEQKTILWIGRFEHEKDPLRAIEVLKEVRKKIDARLVMLGAGGLEHVLKERAEGLPVEFPGWQDPKQYLSHAAVALSTSREESWGASIIEALAAGVPVVAPDVGIAREAGATVVPAERLAETVAEVLQNAPQGHLALSLPTAQAWAAKWRATLSA